MILSARFLTDVGSVNSFEPAEVAEFTAADAASVYFVLIDAGLDRASEGFVPAGRRFIPAEDSTLQCVVESIDDAKTVTRYATNPFADDRSIWKLDFLASDTIRGTANLRLVLNQDGVVTRGVVKNGVRISSTTCI